MRYFLDTEFLDDGTTIDLISLGMVAEDGRELYVCNLDARLDLAAKDSWMKENVLAKLPPFGDKAWMHKRGNWPCPGIREAVLDFMLTPEVAGRPPSWPMLSSWPLSECPTPDGKKPEIWGYYSSYDWVAFCQIFGKMLDLPRQFPKFCRDLKTLADDIQAPKFPKPEGAHNALVDAHWNRNFYDFLVRDRARPKPSVKVKDV
jgi:3' exoribonuclease, RNase T-like